MMTKQLKPNKPPPPAKHLKNFTITPAGKPRGKERRTAEMDDKEKLRKKLDTAKDLLSLDKELKEVWDEKT